MHPGVSQMDRQGEFFAQRVSSGLTNSTRGSEICHSRRRRNAGNVITHPGLVATRQSSAECLGASA